MPSIGSLIALEGRKTKQHIAAEDVLILAAHAFGKHKTYLIAHPEKIVSALKARRFQTLVHKRLQGYSVATMLGSKEFYGLRFAVTKDVLIPRPETELLIDITRPYLDSLPTGRVLDVGTGSGNIIVTLAKLCRPPSKASLLRGKPRHRYYASDVSLSALSVARRNARAHKVQIKFFHSSLFKKIPRQQFDLIIANLPYLTTAQLKEPSIQKEPRQALFGGPGGTALYKKCIAELQNYLSRPGLCVIEIDPRQSRTLLRYVKQHMPKSTIAIHRDLAGRRRVIAISLL